MTLTTINLAALGDTINLSTEVTGTLPTGNGGTGSTATTFVNAASNVTGTLPSANLPTVPVTKGGTGLTSGTTDQFLKFTGTTTVASAVVVADSGLASQQVFTSSGTWTKPTGITKVKVTVIGGGTGAAAGGGMTSKGVAKYRKDNPGSKLKTAVTTPPSKLKKGSKAAKTSESSLFAPI